jgi:hypothetical protein
MILKQMKEQKSLILKAVFFSSNAPYTIKYSINSITQQGLLFKITFFIKCCYSFYMLKKQKKPTHGRLFV